MLLARRRTALVAIAITALACNQGLEPRVADGTCPAGFVGICGTVQLQGAVPDSTDFVFIVAFEQFPQSTDDLFSFKPTTLRKLGLKSPFATYQLELDPARYEWVLAVWKKVGGLSLSNADSLLREAGFYRDPMSPGAPGAVTVTGGVSHVDFVVHFDDMHTISYWFPPAVAPR